MVEILIKEEKIFDQFVKDLKLQSVYTDYVMSGSKGPIFIRLNEFSEIEVYEKYDTNLLKVVNIDSELDDSFSLFFKITKGI
ncbi:hypothetical protein [Staphylococcus phage vB_StaM_SA1]|nr:hypothetical protein [Staphylococcus phage vB_StaM_SA1]